jgi:hypothetical protein
MHQLKDQNTCRFKSASTQLVGCLLVTLVGISASGGQVTNATESTALPSSKTQQLTQASLTQPSSGLTESPSFRTIAQANPSTAAPANRTNNRVKVFFPPVTSSNFTDVRAVWRTTSSSNLAQFAIEQLIAGPNSAEKQRRGLMPVIRMSGSSNCGRDFTLSMDKGLARLKFCKQVVSGGIGDDARAKSSINATLKQFYTVKDVIILDRNGNCFGDQSGDNICLKKK